MRSNSLLVKNSNVFRSVLTHAPNSDKIVCEKLDQLVSLTNKDETRADSHIRVDLTSLLGPQVSGNLAPIPAVGKPLGTNLLPVIVRIDLFQCDMVQQIGIVQCLLDSAGPRGEVFQRSLIFPTAQANLARARHWLSRCRELSFCVKGLRNHEKVFQDHSKTFCNWSFRRSNRQPHFFLEAPLPVD